MGKENEMFYRALKLILEKNDNSDSAKEKLMKGMLAVQYFNEVSKNDAFQAFLLLAFFNDDDYSDDYLPWNAIKDIFKENDKLLEFYSSCKFDRFIYEKGHTNRFVYTYRMYEDLIAAAMCAELHSQCGKRNPEEKLALTTNVINNVYYYIADKCSDCLKHKLLAECKRINDEAMSTIALY